METVTQTGRSTGRLQRLLDWLVADLDHRVVLCASARQAEDMRGLLWEHMNGCVDVYQRVLAP